MTKINHEEYEILKGLEDIWKWIARDNRGYGTKLKAHTSRPGKMIDSRWSSGDIMLQLSEREGLFQFVQWEDSEPYNIQELIEEYEKEREETEVKRDIEWAKNKIDLEVIRRIGREEPHFYVNVGLKMALDVLNQLDEPETLSEEWLDENKSGWMNLKTGGYYIPVEKLQNQLVPKQEKVIVDKEDAENIVDYKEMGWTLSHLINDYGKDARHDELLAKAWLAYPNIEVEEEPKYYLKIGNLYLAEPLGDMTSDIVRMTRDKEVAYQFTDEKSIATHLDKFEGVEAVKVEELEENGED